MPSKRSGDWQSFRGPCHKLQDARSLTLVRGLGGPGRKMPCNPAGLAVKRPKPNPHRLKGVEILQGGGAFLAGQNNQGGLREETVPAGLHQSFSPIKQLDLERSHRRPGLAQEPLVIEVARQTAEQRRIPANGNQVSNAVAIDWNLAGKRNRIVSAWPVQREKLCPVSFRELEREPPFRSVPRIKVRQVALGFIEPCSLDSDLCARGHRCQPLDYFLVQNRAKAIVPRGNSEHARRSNILDLTQIISHFAEKCNTRYARLPILGVESVAVQHSLISYASQTVWPRVAKEGLPPLRRCEPCLFFCDLLKRKLRTQPPAPSRPNWPTTSSPPASPTPLAPSR